MQAPGGSTAWPDVGVEVAKDGDNSGGAREVETVTDPGDGEDGVRLCLLRLQQDVTSRLCALDDKLDEMRVEMSRMAHRASVRSDTSTEEVGRPARGSAHRRGPQKPAAAMVRPPLLATLQEVTQDIVQLRVPTEESLRQLEAQEGAFGSGPLSLSGQHSSKANSSNHSRGEEEAAPPSQDGKGGGGVGLEDAAGAATESGNTASAMIGRDRRNISELSAQMWKIMEDQDSSGPAYIYARVHSMFIICGVCFLLAQTVDPPPFNGFNAAIIDLLFDFLLLAEFCIRYSMRPMSNWRFWSDPFNLLDLVSTMLPVSLRAMHGFVIREGMASGNVAVKLLFTTVPSMRLLKLLRRFQRYQLLTHAFWLILEALPVLIYTFLLIALLFSSAIHLAEPHNFQTLASAVWFTVVTMTTVGYGDRTPDTTLGSVIALCLMILSALYMAMPIGIVGHAFSTVWCDRDRILLMKRTRHKIQEWGYNAHDIPELFRQYDVDSSGELDMEEFRQMITEMGMNLSDRRIVELFESIDSDRGGSIDHKEFIRCLFPSLYHELCVQPELEDAGRGDDGGLQGAYVWLRKSWSRTMSNHS